MAASNPTTTSWGRLVREAVDLYALTCALVLTGIALGLVFGSGRQLSPNRAPQSGVELLDVALQWDGQWYHQIVLSGYSYHPQRMSAVAFFPLYPLLARALAAVTGLRAELALLAVSHAFLIATFVLLMAYVQQRFPGEGPQRARLAALSLAVFPMAFFMTMAYTESLFLFLCLAALYAIERRAPPLAVAAVIALATATRAAGVALLVPLAMHVWDQRSSARQAAASLLYLVPVACLGLLAYMLYQFQQFGTPLAFAQTQDNWRMVPRVGLGEHLMILTSFEPIWSAYLSDGPAYWGNVESGASRWLSLQFANPIFFVAAAGLIYVGGLRRWLSKHEAVLAAAILAISYATRGYEMAMASQARYAASAFPLYLVLGTLLMRSPRGVRWAWLALSIIYLVIYSATWTAGYLVI